MDATVRPPFFATFVNTQAAAAGLIVVPTNDDTVADEALCAEAALCLVTPATVVMVAAAARDGLNLALRLAWAASLSEKVLEQRAHNSRPFTAV